MKRKWKKGIVALILAVLLAGCTGIAAFADQIVTDSLTVQYGQSEARSMLAMINGFRTGNDAWARDEEEQIEWYTGLGNLTYDYALERIAMQRAAELILSFSHDRPNGESCFEAEYNGVHSWGENIAMGTGSFTAADAFELWQETNCSYNGQGHRRNMLGRGWQAVGIGHVVYRGTHYWVQEFGYSVSSVQDPGANDSYTQVSLQAPASSFENQQNASGGGQTSGLYGGWKQSGGRWWFQLSDGSYLSSVFAEIKGTWYYFDEDGWMATGWQLLNDDWYYFNSSGAMAIGWANLGGTWYYFNEDGWMVTGWLNDGGTWYYLTGSGAMATGWAQIGGTWYYMTGSGAMATGWVYDGSAWYYLTGSGAMATGWLNDGGTWYYLTGSGAMATGWLQIGGTWYYMTGSGAMATEGWHLIGNTYYYMYASGAMAADTWIGGYYVNADGAWVS